MIATPSCRDCSISIGGINGITASSSHIVAEETAIHFPTSYQYSY